MTTQAGLPRIQLLSAVAADNGAPSAGVASTGTLTLAANATDGETVVVGSTTYTWQDSVGAGETFGVEIGASASDSIDNLIAVINDTLEITRGAGLTEVDEVVAVAGAGDTMDVTAKAVGTGGDALATTETMANGSWGGATLSGGANRDGVRVKDLLPGIRDPDYRGGGPDKAFLMIVLQATGAVSADVYIHGYEDAGPSGNDGEYSLLGSGTNVGHVNGGVAIAGTTKKVWRDILFNLGALDELYLEVLNLTGTSPTVDAYITYVDEDVNEEGS